MSKSDQGLPGLERVMLIDGLLRVGRYPGRETLAEKCEVDVRTISRDLDFMRDRLGAPIEYDRSRRGYYYADPSFFLPEVSMTEGELLAVFLASSVTRQMIGSRVGGHMENALAKLAKNLPARVTVPLSELARHVSLHPRPSRQVDTENLQVLQEAMRRWPVWIRYYSAHRDQVTQRVIEPLHLRYHLGDWYVVAFCRLRGDVRTFAVSRVHEAVVKPGQCPDRPDFDPEHYFASALGILAGQQAIPVRIWFASSRARWVKERHWHPSQRLEILEDGSVILEMSVASTAELLQWVLGYGSEARVIAPKALADEVRGQAEQILSSYKTGN